MGQMFTVRAVISPDGEGDENISGGSKYLSSFRRKGAEEAKT